MSWDASFGSWLVYSALASLAVLMLGASAVLLCRQPARRLRIIELTLVGSLVVPCLGMVPGYPQWSIGWLPAPPEPYEAAAVPSSEPALVPAVSQAEALPRPAPDIASRPFAPAVETPAPARDAGSWLVAIYLLGVAMAVAWWLAGVVALARIVWSAHAAPAHCRRLLAEIAGPRAPRVRLLVSRRAKQPFASVGVAVQLPPQRGPWRRAVIVLPFDMCDDEQAVRWALAHEWAHVERQDFRAWFVAGLARMLLYYQPLVWWLRRQLRLYQDFVADARASREASEPEDYAEFLTLRAAAGTLHPAMVGLGMGFRRSELYRRVVMLVENPPLESRTPRLWNVLVSLAALALMAILPALSLTSESAAQEQGNAPHKASAGRKVPFVTGPQLFPEDDKIEIEEVWSKKGSLATGDTVTVKGTYSLKSRRTATLLLSVTETRTSGNGPATTRVVRAGTAPFELEMPIVRQGYLHVGFYDVQTGGCFGTVYFGTYKQMGEISGWNLESWMYQGRPARRSSRPEPAAQEPEEATQQESSALRKVPFVIGPHKFGNGDKIEIEEVWSKRGSLAGGDTVKVKGTYTLESRSLATLLFSVTKTRSTGTGGSTLERPVWAGTAPFELELPVIADGYLHFGFYDVQTHVNFGTVYFGTYPQMAEMGNWTLDWVNTDRAARSVFGPAPPSQEPEKPLQRKPGVAKRVSFVLGPRLFPQGDKIEIKEVWSELGSLAKGDTVTVKGTYHLKSHYAATLLFSITQDGSKGPQGGCTLEQPVKAGLMPFEFELPVAVDGHLHLGLYDAETGGCFGTVYFGTSKQMKEISRWNLKGWMNQGRPDRRK